MKLEDYIASIENYPKEGVTFRDISPLMADGNAYSYAIREIVQYATDKKIDMIVGPEARGFIVGCPVAFELGIGFAPVRKPGKLPREVISANYEKSMVLIHFVCMPMQSSQANVYLSLMTSWQLVVPSKLQLK